MFDLNDQKLTELAMNFDPSPVLMAFGSIPGGNMLTQPQPEGVTPAPGASYESILAGAASPGPLAPQERKAAPLSDVALRTLAAMNPPTPPRAPAAGIVRGGQVQFAPVVGPAQRPLGLAQILGGR